MWLLLGIRLKSDHQVVRFNSIGMISISVGSSFASIGIGYGCRLAVVIDGWVRTVRSVGLVGMVMNMDGLI